MVEGGKAVVVEGWGRAFSPPALIDLQRSAAIHRAHLSLRGLISVRRLTLKRNKPSCSGGESVDVAYARTRQYGFCMLRQLQINHILMLFLKQ